MSTNSSTRKVWVRRRGASATLVPFSETDVVDDVREVLLHKYANSLGRVYDAPDLTLRLIPRETHQGERTLGPDEVMMRTLDVYYPGGQTMDEALIIEVPHMRRTTPNVSPHGGPPHASHLASGYRDSHGPGGTGGGGGGPGGAGPSAAGHGAAGHGVADHHVDYFGPAVVPEYYNHAAGSEYGSTLVPELAYNNRGPGSQHHYPTSPGGHHAVHSQSSHKPHLNLSLRSPPGASSGGSSSTTQGNSGPAISPLNHPHSISIISTGQAPQIPSIPSPGGTRRSHKDRSDRPKLYRQVSTTDPDDGSSGINRESTLQLNGGHSNSSAQKALGINGSMAAMATAVSAGRTRGRSGSVTASGDAKSKGAAGVIDGVAGKDMNGTANGASGGGRSLTSPPRTMSPIRGKKQKKAVSMARPLDDERRSPVVQLGPLTVPPINVLIVEDNIINLKLLEAFVKRLKVRWQTAMNGRDAVTKWRSGGFHLVLMDIQLPLMSGLEATREIRRLERVNSIGVFASTPSDSIGVGRDPQSDKLTNKSLFKSPVIIVALTASSLQSDRNDALAAGCNDFLTKPVNFLWLEKKIMEWGCMQALIDFDGWRKWKELKLPWQQGDGIDGAADPSSKKSKKSGGGGEGHARRPSMSSLGRDTGESSDTLNTVSSHELGPPTPTTNARARRGSRSGSPSGSGSGSNSVGRSPLSHPSVFERLAAHEASAANSNVSPPANLSPPASGNGAK